MRIVVILIGMLFVACAPVRAEPMRSAQIAALTGTGAFEFRGTAHTAVGLESHIWYFARDGRIRSESAQGRFLFGGWAELFGYRASGTWRREGDRFCVAWQEAMKRFDGCYSVLTGRDGMIHLTGPQFFEGTLSPAGNGADAGVPPRR